MLFVGTGGGGRGWDGIIFSWAGQEGFTREPAENGNV